ncbi:hypothetical protein SEA_XENIA2_10 [Gordonia phage Xenia2]
MAIRKVNLPSAGRGRAWGNALGGYKTQRRNGLGEFARSGQKTARERYLDTLAKSRKRGKVAPATKVRNPDAKTPSGKAAMRSMTVQVAGTSKLKRNMGIAGGTATTVAILRAITGVSPFVDVSRKNFRVGIKPSMSLGKNFKLGTTHSIGIERTTDDIFDRTVKNAQAGVSSGTRKLFGNGRRGDFAVNVADNITGRKNQLTVAGAKLTQEGGGAGTARRWRYSGGGAAVPGSPPSAKKGKTKRKPGKGAHTVTTTAKGTPAVRGQRRKKKSRAASQKRRGRTYTK